MKIQAPRELSKAILFSHQKKKEKADNIWIKFTNSHDNLVKQAMTTCASTKNLGAKVFF